MGNFYCRNCGTALKPETNFCTNCGTKIVNPKSNKSELENDSIVKESISSNTPNGKLAIEENSINSISEELTGGKYKFAKRIMIFYILLNIPLYYLNSGTDEILGILIFSIIVLWDFFVFILNKQKKKPFNIITKIVLVLQMLLAISAFMNNYELFFSNIYSASAVITFALLSIVNVMLILKGNKI